MADGTHIQWTNATWNLLTGCTLVDHGCDHCYAARLAATRLQHHPSRAGLTRVNAAGVAKFTGEVRFNEQWLDQPLRWTKPRRIFVCAHGDLFHESVPDDWIDQAFAVMALAPQHTFQVLTKRPERAREYFRETKGWRSRIAGLLNDMKPSPLWNGNVYQGWQNLHGRPDGLPNVWLGTSISDQSSADARIPELLACPAAVRFVSAEPLLGPVDLTRVGNLAAIDNVFPTLATPHRRDMAPEPISGAQIDAINGAGSSCLFYQTPNHMGGFSWEFPRRFPRLDWVICGGESGPGARPMHPDWARSLRDQCVAAGVPFFFKQWGEWGAGDGLGDEVDGCQFGCFDDAGQWVYPVDQDWATRDRLVMFRVGKKTAGRVLDDRTWDQMPGAKDA